MLRAVGVGRQKCMGSISASAPRARFFSVKRSCTVFRVFSTLPRKTKLGIIISKPSMPGLVQLPLRSFSEIVYRQFVCHQEC